MNEKYYRDIKGQVFQYNPNTGDWENLEIKLTEELLSLKLQTHNCRSFVDPFSQEQRKNFKIIDTPIS